MNTTSEKGVEFKLNNLKLKPLGQVSPSSYLLVVALSTFPSDLSLDLSYIRSLA